MIINKLTPQGYCGGVKKAIEIAYQAIDDSLVKKPLYLLGSIIHNQHVIDDLTNKGAIIIEDKNRSRAELLDQIKEGTVIFSAHGVAPSVYTKALAKGLNIIDTTCPNVKLIQNKIKTQLEAGYTCLYIGTAKHPECEAILEISKEIILIETKDDITKLNLKSDKIFITNQTTLSLYDTKIIYETIKKLYPKAIIDNKICQATTIRQQAVLNQKKVDLCIVVGDEKSSNTQKLLSASQRAGIEAILVSDLTALKKYDLSNVKSVSVTSGASTPEYIVDMIIEYLNKI